MTTHKVCLGMWHRPFEKTLDEVTQTLIEVEELGFSHLFIETYYNGKLIYPSRVSLLDMHEWIGEYGTYGSDLLKAFIEEGRKYNIKIHAWVENFFVGQFNTIEETYWYQHKLSWLLPTRNQSYLHIHEKKYVFLDPANDEVNKYIKSLYQELVEIHKGLESLHLDYIRYPLVYDITPPNITDDVGYSRIALKKLNLFYQEELNLLHDAIDVETYQKWCNFKIAVINTFVKEVYEIIKLETSLSIAIFGDVDHAKKHKMQDWMTWIEQGLIQLIIPMAYYKDEHRVFEEVSKLNNRVNGLAKVFAGIAPSYIGLNAFDNHKQILASIKANAEGVVLFASQNYLTKHFMGETLDRDDIKKLFKFIKKEGFGT